MGSSDRESNVPQNLHELSLEVEDNPVNPVSNESTDSAEVQEPSKQSSTPDTSPATLRKRKRDLSPLDPVSSDELSDEGYVSSKRPRFNHKPLTTRLAKPIPHLTFTPASPTQHDRAGHTVPGVRLTQKRKFHLWGALCNHPGLLIYLTTQFMTPDEVIGLYSIDKYFHWTVNSFLSYFMYGLARRWSCMTPPALIEQYADLNRENPYQEPDVCRIFPWRNYRWLCIADPSRRPMELPRVDPEKAEYDIMNSRHVPSFKYLRMVLFRASTVRSILESMLYNEQTWLPPDTADTLAKLWFMMDIPVTGVRVKLVVNKNYFTDRNLELAQLFSVKLDMAINDAAKPSGRAPVKMRHLLWAQRSLSVMDRVLKRHACRDHLEALQMFVEWRYKPPTHFQGSAVMGIASDLVGALEKEGWGDDFSGRGEWNAPRGSRFPREPGPKSPDRHRLIRPDNLIPREWMRRGYRNTKETYRGWMLSGYHHPVTLEPWSKAKLPEGWPRKWWMWKTEDEESTMDEMARLERDAEGQYAPNDTVGESEEQSDEAVAGQDDNGVDQNV